MTERGFGDSPTGGSNGGADTLSVVPATQGPIALLEGLDFQAILQIADSLPVMIALIDPGQVYRFCNQSVADWFERPRSAILGRPIAEVMGADAYGPRKGPIEAALKGQRQHFAADFTHPTRGPLTTQAEYVPQLDDSGAVTGVLMIVQDITEQRAAERALKESEARFRRIANSAPAPMWVTRADGSRDFVNQAYLEFFGFPPEAVGQHDWKTALHPDDVERIERDYVAGLAAGEAFEMEARFRRADGAWRWMRSTSRPRLDAEGRVIGFIGVAADVTVAKEAELELRRQVEERTRALEEAEDQLRQSQKMEALGQLTGGIAHDFNNLLTVVVGGLDLILKRTEDDKVRRYARNALTSAERGARLTGQLLAFSRVQRLEIRPVQVDELIDEMRPILRNVLGPGVDKHVDLLASPGAVTADPTQVEMAILNLAINARDAMPGGGTLTIATRDVRVEDGDAELEPGDYVEITISDTGTGMPPEVAARAFEPFFTTKDVGRGTGLGLSMVYGMTRQSGGTARIASEEGVGTTVSLFFRRDGEGGDEAAHSRTGAPKGSAHRALKVLVIDDDADVRDFLVANLEEYRYRVAEASDGPSGIERFDRFHPDVVVLDYLMPGMTGAEVATRLLEKTPGQKILFVSGYNETEAIARAAPGAAVLAKPFRPEALDEAIRKLVAD